PDANGSSVPVCPIRRVPRARRATATASCEVGPTGLSIASTPVGGSGDVAILLVPVVTSRRGVVRARGRRLLRRRAHGPQQLLDAAGMLQRRVDVEAQLWRVADPQPP